MSARACVTDGAWEDAVAYLQKASSTAAENSTNTGATFSKIRKEHVEKLAEWKTALATSEAKLTDLDSQPGLSQDMLKQRNQLKDFVDEHKNAIAHSEWAIQEIDGLLDRLQKDQETDAKSLAAWQEFLAKEKEEIASAGSVQKYVADKLVQVKADETRPRGERIAYGRRLLRLDPTNKDCRQFLEGLLGLDEVPEAPVKKPAPAKKIKAKKVPAPAKP
jgi:chromosome segregation ATPase